MPAPDLELPDDGDALKAMVIALAEQRAQVEARNVQLEARNTHLEAVNKTAEARIARLTATIKVLERARFGSRSERLRTGTLSEEQYALVFDEIETGVDRKSTRLNSSHVKISYAVFCLKKKKKNQAEKRAQMRPW